MAKKKQTSAMITVEKRALLESDPARQGTSRNMKTATAKNLSTEQRHQMISDKAYYIAEQRGFNGDAAMQDWLQAERQIDE